MFYTVTPACYDELCTRLTDAIGGRNYFSGTLAFDCEGVECTLVLSAVVYRRTERAPEGCCEPICDLVPVWWEFHTRPASGDELLNDFSFDEVRRRL